MQKETRVAAIPQGSVAAATATRPLQLLSVMLIGGVMLYFAGFMGSAEMHNAAHDMRHTIGFPCH